MFWAPEVLPTVLRIASAVGSTPPGPPDLDLRKVAGAEYLRAPDGWHAVLRVGGATHRLWSDQRLAEEASVVLQLPFDVDFDLRAAAAYRLWSALQERPCAPSRPVLSLQRRQRLMLALRALDGRSEGSSYRAIAEVLFGERSIPDRSWKTHDLRNRTIRLVQSGLSLMRGGYRLLLRRGRRDE